MKSGNPEPSWHPLVSIDYAQIEHRLLAMASNRQMDPDYYKQKIQSLPDPFSLPIEILGQMILYAEAYMLPIPDSVRIAFNQKAQVQRRFDPPQFLPQAPVVTPKDHVKQTIAPLPEDILVQFIGGPANAEQKYYQRKNLQLKDGDLLAYVVKTDLPPIQLDENNNIQFKVTETEPVWYKLTHVPLDQTPFSNAEIVIAIFQEKV
jgi:hypothetical protein